jgi:ribose transport system permease protein
MTDRREWLRRNQAILLAYAMAIALFLGTAIFASGFGTWSHTKVMLVQACFIGIVGLGQTFVVLGGGVDLSVPWMLNASATLLTLWGDGSDGNLVWVLPAIAVIALAVGLLNGFGVAVLGVSPIIMTLGVNGVLQGALLLVTNGGQSPSAPPAVVSLATGSVLGVPSLVLIWIALAALAWLGLSRTTYGRRLYAVGTNARVAYLSGVRVTRVTVLSYVVSALASALAGVLLTGYVGEAYLGMGDVYLFSSVAAVVIGGASILGGRGHYAGTVAGALILTLLASLLPILNLEPAALQVVYGVAILLTVGLASVRLGGR